MKTRKMRLIALMITLAAVMTGINAEAQRREYRTERDNPGKGKREYTERKQNKREYKKPNSDRRRENKRDYQASRNYKLDRNYQHWDREDHSKKYQKKNWDNHSNKYNKKYWNNQFRYDKRYEYNHPRYGHVYKRFHAQPIRVRHYNNDYYFYGGQCFHHYHGIGYVRIDFPRNLILVNLPFQCELIRVGHHAYYRYGDLVFERCDRGFRLAPSIGIQLSAHF